MRQKRNWTKEDEKYILDNMDKPDSELALHFGVSLISLQRFKTRNGIRKYIKWTDELSRDVLSALEHGKSIATISQEYGIPETSIRARLNMSVKKTTGTTGNKPRKVVAYEAECVRVFNSIEAAARHYRIHRDTVLKSIHDGETCKCGASFDWARFDK